MPDHAVSLFYHFKSAPNLILSPQIISYAFLQVLMDGRRDADLRTPGEDGQIGVLFPKKVRERWNRQQSIERLEVLSKVRKWIHPERCF